MNISSSWREQYDRMHRGLRRLLTISRGEGTLSSSDEARDALYHFFQDAYHLKDWILNDDAVVIDGKGLEDRISDNEALSLCTDLCNGTKHLRLRGSQGRRRGPRTGDASTAFASQSVVVRPAAAGSGQPPRPALHSWTVQSKGKTHDAVTLAGEVVRAWEDALRAEGLQPGSQGDAGSHLSR